MEETNSQAYITESFFKTFRITMALSSPHLYPQLYGQWFRKLGSLNAEQVYLLYTEF